MQAQACRAAPDDEVVGLERELVGAGDLEPHGARVAAGMDHEVEFGVALRAVKDDVDAGIDATIHHAAVHRHVLARGVRIAREVVVVVRLAGLLIGAGHGRRGHATDPADADRLALHVLAGPCRNRDETRLVDTKPQTMACRMRYVTNVGRGLADIRFENQGQARERRSRLGRERECHGEQHHRSGSQPSCHLAHVR